ncbi:hypothetical protein HC024_14295 [Methylococcaceae bacterium WWC4]|nr:hypothetical protein [Methylococcaceae bacterium WWC4]
MRFPLISLLIAASSFADAEAIERYPVANSAYFDGTGVKSAADGKLVAVEGKILRIASGPQEKPMYQLSLTQSANRTVWVGNVMFDKETKLPIGTVVRVFGYLQRVKDDDTWTKAVSFDDHHILGFCFLNTTTQMAIYLPNGIKQCEAWQNGQTPEQIAR